jgi:hypothetical protein
MVSRVFVGWLVAAALSFAGCGGETESGRVPLHGSVRVDGMPVAEGSISLLPASGHSGPAATTSIAGGQYVFTRETGPVAGPHRVVVGVVATAQGETTGAGGMTDLDGPPSDAAMKSAPSGDAARGAGQRSARRPAEERQTQWEADFDVPTDGDFRADLDLGTN